MERYGTDFESQEDYNDYMRGIQEQEEAERYAQEEALQAEMMAQEEAELDAGKRSEMLANEFTEREQ